MSDLGDALYTQMLRTGNADGWQREYRFHPVRRWRFDIADPVRMIALECDGGTWAFGRHNRPAGYEKDCIKLNEAACLGWRVLRFTGAMIQSGDALRYVEAI